MSRPTEWRIQLAERQIDSGNPRAAVETLRQILAEDPEAAYPHALIAFALIGTKRLHAAEVEAAHALAIDPGAPSSHFAMAEVRFAQTRLPEAEVHLNQALAIDPELVGARVQLAEIHKLNARRDLARGELMQALSVQPCSAGALTALAQLDILEGNLGEAEHRLRSVLAELPMHSAATIAMGHLLLQRGDLEAAREHAIVVIQRNPNSPSALQLLASIKARKNPIIGSWWRYAVWMERHGESAQIGLLLGAFFFYRVLVAYTTNTGNEPLRTLVDGVWFGIVAYSWFAPLIFMRLLRKEIGEVKLRGDF